MMKGRVWLIHVRIMRKGFLLLSRGLDGRRTHSLNSVPHKFESEVLEDTLSSVCGLLAYVETLLSQHGDLNE
jgi:hypothetical protein